MAQPSGSPCWNLMTGSARLLCTCQFCDRQWRPCKPATDLDLLSFFPVNPSPVSLVDPTSGHLSFFVDITNLLLLDQLPKNVKSKILLGYWLVNPSLQCTRLNNHSLALPALWEFGGLTEALMETAGDLAQFLKGWLCAVCLSSHCQNLRELEKILPFNIFWACLTSGFLLCLFHHILLWYFGSFHLPEAKFLTLSCTNILVKPQFSSFQALLLCFLFYLIYPTFSSVCNRHSLSIPRWSLCEFRHTYFNLIYFLLLELCELQLFCCPIRFPYMIQNFNLVFSGKLTTYLCYTLDVHPSLFSKSVAVLISLLKPLPRTGFISVT